MFSDIEKKYRAGLSEQRFWRYYLTWSLPSIILAIIGASLLGLNSWLLSLIVALLLIGYIVVFLFRDMRAVVGVDQLRKIPTLRGKVSAYAKADDIQRLDNLIEDLRKHHLSTRDDLRLAMEYFERQQPVDTKTGLLDWVLSIAIALASVVAITYDDSTRHIDELKLFGILLPTVKIVLIITVPTFIIAIIAKKLFFSRAKIESILIEDLAYLYVNFDQYAKRLR